jgi:predicted sulfurtransferase
MKPASQQLSPQSPPQTHGHVVLFYRYFLPANSTTNHNQNCTDEGELDDATLQFFHAHANHYLPLLRTHQNALCEKLGMKGRILVSTEGINGTLSYHEMDLLKQYQREMHNFDLLSQFDTPSDLKSNGEKPMAGKGRLFTNIDWKISPVNRAQEPFPDLKVQIVKEIVNTGGTIDAYDIPSHSGKEISPEEFHNILLQARVNGGWVADQSEQNETMKKEVVLIDVRNTFEHAIGHFVHPHSNTTIPCSENTETSSETTPPAINPNTVTFSHFDSNFCAKYSDVLKDKKVLMYCTGGIRCVKASAMLKKRGVQDVSHLSGGIHRYLEKYSDRGFYKGKCMVFDQRVALEPAALKVSVHGDEAENKEEEIISKNSNVVGRCIECQVPWDQISGAILCTVCRDLVLICELCRASIREFHCVRHRRWKNAYFTFLNSYSIEELEQQSTMLEQLHDSYDPPKEHKNVRRTLRKQIEKVRNRIDELKSGCATVKTTAKRYCRTCFEPNDICDGLCWGFWKQTTQSSHQHQNNHKLEPIMAVQIGDRCQPGPHWNEFRLGTKFTLNPKRVKTEQSRSQSQSSGMTLKTGTVVQIKSWGSGGNENDCVAVLWDDDSSSVGTSRRKRQRNQEKTDETAIQQADIYRWGTVARNGQRMYDVQLLS